MASVVSWIFLLLVIVAGVFYLAPHVAGRGNYFVVSVCSIGGTFCQHPEYVTLTAAAAGALWIILWSLGR